MFATTKKIAAVATLALAALPALAIATGAHAAPVAVKVADLNLNSADGVAAYQQRAAVAAQSFCREAPAVGTLINRNTACIAGVKAELNEKLAQAQQPAATVLAAR